MKPKVVLLIFVSGKIVLTGAKVREEIYMAFNQIYSVLSGASLLLHLELDLTGRVPKGVVVTLRSYTELLVWKLPLIRVGDTRVALSLSGDRCPSILIILVSSSCPTTIPNPDRHLYTTPTLNHLKHGCSLMKPKTYLFPVRPPLIALSAAIAFTNMISAFFIGRD